MARYIDADKLLEVINKLGNNYAMRKPTLRYLIEKCPKVFDGDVSIALGYKVYSDATLMSMKKSEIIETLRVAEHNYFAAKQTLDIQFENVKNWEPVVHGRWIKYPLMYKCSVCGAGTSSDMANYCFMCGAKMDMGGNSDG